jgi:hypothetical protein
MDFRSLLQTMTSLNEAETKDTKTGRVHKGDYGTSYEAGDEGVKKAETTRGRGRPKKGSDEATGEVKKYDTKGVGDVFGGGKKPKGEVGTKSVKHSLKEYIESVEESIVEGETIEKKGGRVHKGSYGTSYEAGDEGVKKAETTRGRGRPKKGADDSTGEVKKYDTKSLGSAMGAGKAPTKAVGKVSASHKIKEGMTAPIEIKPASATNTQVIQQGNKTLGTVNNPQLAAQIKQSIGKGEMSLNPNEEGMAEGKDEGKPGKNFAKIAKSAGEKYGSKAAGERVAGAVRAKLMKQGKLEEAKPDFLDMDKDGDKKESFKKAVKDKEARKKKIKESINFNEMAADTKMQAQQMLSELQDDIETFVNTGHCSDQLEAFLKVHGHSKKKMADESAMSDFAIQGVKPTSSFSQPGTAMATPRPASPFSAGTPTKTPSGDVGNKAFNFITGLGRKSEPKFESTDMKDIQLESWENQLNSLLTEGITVSSSQGQQGAPDSVSVTASDADAQELMSVLRQAGIGGFGGGEQSQQPQIGGASMMAAPGQEPDGTGQSPEMSPNVVGDGDDMMALIKKMTGIQDQGPTAGFGDEEGGQDYEDEEGEDTALQPADGEEENSSDVASDEEGSEEGADDEESSEEEEVTDEGNAFTGKLKQTPQGGSFKMGDKQYKDTSSIEEGHDEDCNECGYAVEDCACPEEHVEESYANETGHEELAQLKALLGMGNDMHRQKQSQATGNIQKVTMETKLMKETGNLLTDWQKLSGIK